MVIENFIEAVDMGSALIGAGFFVFVTIIALWWIKKYSDSPSYRYRKYLTNLYVCGKIKQLAEGDKINLDKMDKDCLKYFSVSNKRKIRELDDKIEAEIIEKIERKTKEEKKENKEESK